MNVTAFEELSEKRIKSALPEKLRAAPIYVFQTIDSTNTYAKALALSGAANGTLVLSEEQTAGRGRRGKSFFSPKSSGLYMSLMLRPKALCFDVQLVTVAAAAAVCRALESLAGVQPQIKWVNDVYLDGRKLCGILCEKVSDDNEAVIAGVGINCGAAAFPEELQNIAGALNVPVSRNELAARIVSELNKVMAMDSAAVIEQYRSRSLMEGRRVRYAINGESTEATVCGIADNGNLLVVKDNGERLSLSSGEVSVKGIGEWQ